MSADVPEPAEPTAAVELLTRIGDLAWALVDLERGWPLAIADKTFAGDLRWCASALAEQFVALLRGDHARSVDLADSVAQAVSDARVAAGLIETGDKLVCGVCGVDYRPGEGHVCREDWS